MISESAFNTLVDDTLLQIEEALDEAESDLDYVNNGGVLTVICETGQQLIFTRQTPVRQLWVAVPFGGFHFDHDGQQWLCDGDQQPLSQFLHDTFAKLADEQLGFEV